VRHREGDTWNAGSHPQVQVIQRAGADAHQNLVGLDLRLGNIFVDQNIRRAVLMNASSFHEGQYNVRWPDDRPGPLACLSDFVIEATAMEVP